MEIECLIAHYQASDKCVKNALWAGDPFFLVRPHNITITIVTRAYTASRSISFVAAATAAKAAASASLWNAKWKGSRGLFFRDRLSVHELSMRALSTRVFSRGKASADYRRLLRTRTEICCLAPPSPIRGVRRGKSRTKGKAKIIGTAAGFFLFVFFFSYAAGRNAFQPSNKFCLTIDFRK